MPSAVENAQGKEASSTSESGESIAMASSEAAVVYSAKAPSRSEPKVRVESPGDDAAGDCSARTSTRSPTRPVDTPPPVATISPQQSAPCTRGKTSAAPDQLPSSSAVDP